MGRCERGDSLRVRPGTARDAVGRVQTRLHLVDPHLELRTPVREADSYYLRTGHLGLLEGLFVFLDWFWRQQSDKGEECCLGLSDRECL